MKKREELEAKLRSLQSKFSRFYSKILTEKNLTIPQFSLLILAADEGPLQMKDLADRLYISNASVTNLVDRLEKHKLLRRNPHPEDRRAFLIEVTEKGKEVIHEIRKLTVGRVAGKMHDFPDPEITLVLKFYNVMETAVDEMLHEMSSKV